MIHKLAILSALIISAFCAIHPGLYSLVPAPQYSHPDNVNYNFAYDVNHPPTGDIKSQQESRRGDTVTGQYSLVQPDGVRRTVDYKANDLRGFRAIVNNEALSAKEEDAKKSEETKQKDEDRQRDENSEVPKRGANAEKGAIQEQIPQWPIKHVTNAPPASVAISRTSLFQIIRQDPQHFSIGWN